jgi:hypothetical protein
VEPREPQRGGERVSDACVAVECVHEVDGESSATECMTLLTTPRGTPGADASPKRRHPNA